MLYNIKKYNLYYTEKEEYETALSSDETNIFKTGKTYTAKFTIRTESDSDFLSDKLKVTVKGKPVDNLKINADYATFSISYTLVADLLLGDVNGDDVVNITDITKIAAHVKGKKLLTANK